MLCPKLLEWLIQKLQTTRNFCEKNKLCTIDTSLHVSPWLSCQDLAMILASVPCIMACHDLDKGTMVNHDLARLTMILARVPWLRTLGYAFRSNHTFVVVLANLELNIKIHILQWPKTQTHWYKNI